MIHSRELEVRTSEHAVLVDITGKVQDAVTQAGVGDGTVTVYVPHTTAGVTINENADPTVKHDILAQLDAMVPWRTSFYKHGEGNSAAHIKASMMGASVTVPLRGGRPALGTWQGIYFAEFDGPRSRRVIVTVSGE